MGALLNYAKALEGMRLSRQKISRYLTTLVPREDYEQRDRGVIIEHLYRLSHVLKRTEIGGEMGLGEVGKPEGDN